jgi:hypothetical protein
VVSCSGAGGIPAWATAGPFFSITRTPVDALNQQLGARLAVECARRGVTPAADVHVEAQANMLTGGMDLTAAAYVRPVKAAAAKARGTPAPAPRDKAVL